MELQVTWCIKTNHKTDNIIRLSNCLWLINNKNDWRCLFYLHKHKRNFSYILLRRGGSKVKFYWFYNIFVKWHIRVICNWWAGSISLFLLTLSFVITGKGKFSEYLCPPMQVFGIPFFIQFSESSFQKICAHPSKF